MLYCRTEVATNPVIDRSCFVSCVQKGCATYPGSYNSKSTIGIANPWIRWSPLVRLSFQVLQRRDEQVACLIGCRTLQDFRAREILGRPKDRAWQESPSKRFAVSIRRWIAIGARRSYRSENKDSDGLGRGMVRICLARPSCTRSHESLRFTASAADLSV